MVEILEGRKPFLETRGAATDMVLLGTTYEIEGFHLKAYDEFQAYFAEPEPYLEIDLSSAAVIARVVDCNSILLVEFKAEDGERRVELPAGKVKADEDKTIFDTARREFDEETGGITALSNLKPLSVSHHRDERGGLHFYTEIPKLRVEGRDKLGRAYLTPPKGTDRGRVFQLITEPLDVFLDQERTLLRHSRNQWAVGEIVRLTLGLYIQKLDGARK